ncbi:putative zinc transporter msc2 [Coemansia sp. RSA 2607]|nr:putative zinc transporter msc2 [Coemansia sp. RSA 2607]KAJ2381583.1 putative zinc transporter msc2 [Coemansia sp. RSA 2603]
MSPAMPGRSKNRSLTIATVEEYDRNIARKRLTESSKRNHHNHDDHDHDHCHDDHGEHDHGHGHCHSHSLLTRNHSCKHNSPSVQNDDKMMLTRAQQFIRAILDDGESRSIFMFLLLNLSYMVVQVIYGYITNSLGLISDAIHMLFDCMALAIGLIAAVMSKWPPSETFTFGYDRIETLSGFANGVFLMLISISIFFEAIERLIYPPQMNTQRLLLVSFGGLVVNLFGIFAFNGHHHHHHGSGGGCSHSHTHSDSHSHDHSHHRSQNMQGVFLHVMADTLGSVGVIISTLLIQRFGWTGFDPLASIAIAALIFASVVPLVRDSMNMLLLRLSDRSQAEVRMTIDEISQSVECMVAINKVQFWPITESQIVGIVHILVDPERATSLDEQPQCPIDVRDSACQKIQAISRANIGGLRDVFVSVDFVQTAAASLQVKS